MTLENTSPPLKFYESPAVFTEDAMWQTLSALKGEDGCVPLVVENALPWWNTKVMRGKTYSLVPFDQIKLISSQEFEDNERIFLSDHIRGTTSEQ
ncbi:hypothetical protein D3C75_1124650 [compost metagenome]